MTEEVCGPALTGASGLRQGVDFKLGYSPERINPGDKAHTLERVTRVIAAEDAETLARVEAVYRAVVPAGLHRAASIRVAEAAKVTENIQRDLNVALVNELALIFDRIGIRTSEVLAAAGSKWNFLPFRPGLVGGHCVGVDPYYLAAKAEALGYHPQLILAGRRVNDAMGTFIAQKLVKLLAQADVPLRRARVGILGLTFKEDVRDLRNSRVPDIIAELEDFGVEPLVHDPLVTCEEARRECGLLLCGWDALTDLHALVLAVAHRAYLEKPPGELLAPLCPGGIVLDVKSALEPTALPDRLTYWSL